MTRQSSPGLTGLILAAGMLLFAGVACFEEGEVLTVPAASENQAQETARKCEGVLGKAFASAEERQWFIDNCSTWTGEEAPKQAAAPPQAPVQREPEVREPAECARIRGRQYESPQQRIWFLSNCTGFQISAAPVSQGADRTNCDEIRGTQYRSQSERNWYLAHCMYSTGPDRTNCDEIRGTQYRSNAEREWFLANCLLLSPAIQIGGNNDSQGNGNGNGNGRNRGRGDD